MRREPKKIRAVGVNQVAGALDFLIIIHGEVDRSEIKGEGNDRLIVPRPQINFRKQKAPTKRGFWD